MGRAFKDSIGAFLKKNDNKSTGKIIWLQKQASKGDWNPDVAVEHGFVRVDCDFRMYGIHPSFLY